MTWFKNKEFECRVCGRSFKKNRQLKSHLKDKHGLQDSGLKCPNCGEQMIHDFVGEVEQCPSCNWKE